MKFPNAHSGKQVFFKGKGRKGSKKLDAYQRMLLKAERNGFEGEKRQPKAHRPVRKLKHMQTKVLPQTIFNKVDAIKLKLDKRPKIGV